jgi:hypothetical protein
MLVLVLARLIWLPASTSTLFYAILCCTMFATRLAKQLATLHASYIASLKLMSPCLGIHNRKLHILALYQIPVLLLTYSNRRVVYKYLTCIFIQVIATYHRNKTKTCLVIEPLHAPSKTNRG